MSLGQPSDRLKQGRAIWVARIVVGAVISVGLAWVVMRGLDWGRVFETFATFPIPWALLGILAVAASLVLRAYRWRILLTTERISLWNLFLAQNAGTGANNLLPVRMLSEPIQLALVTRWYGLPGPTALATLVVEHVLDVVATAVIMGLGVLFIPALRTVGIPLVGSFILFVVSLLALLVLARGIDSLPFAGRVVFLARFHYALSTVRRNELRVFLSFVFTVAHWFFLGVGGWALGHGLGMNVGLGAMVVLFLAATFFISAVPSLPGGLGAFEFAVMLTLEMLGVEKTLAFTFAVVTHFVVFLPPTAIALIVLPRAGMSLFARKKQRQPGTSELQRAAPPPKP